RSFATPHGGGGPGAGPVAGRAPLAPYLPVPRVVRRGEQLEWDETSAKSVGRIGPFFGNFGILLRALAYIERLGGPGLEEATRLAILNAKYLRARLRPAYDPPSDAPPLPPPLVSRRHLT